MFSHQANVINGEAETLMSSHLTLMVEVTETSGEASDLLEQADTQQQV